MKIIRTAPPKPQPSREIRRFAQPDLGPHHQPVEHPPIQASNEIAREAVKIASSPGKIDPRQQRY
jgi:hypothetical protein